VERVLNESGEPAGQDFTSAFRDSGAIDKGVRGVVGWDSAVVGCLRMSHF